MYYKLLNKTVLSSALIALMRLRDLEYSLLSLFKDIFPLTNGILIALDGE